MKIVKILIALVLTVLMLYIAKSNSRGQSEFLTHTENGYTFEFHTVPKGYEKETTPITIEIKGDFSAGEQVMLRHNNENKIPISDLSRYLASAMNKSDSTKNGFVSEILAGERGGRFYFYYEVIDSTGSQLATMFETEKEPFVFKYIGHVPPVIFISHLFFIFATVFFISLATTSSFPLITGASTDVTPLAKYTFWAVVLCFIGGYPVGWGMNWYAFNGFWEGIPFGTDATDNKTQLLFVYIVFAMLAMWGSFRGNPKKDLYSAKTSGWLGIISFFVMLAIYLIPHSIQFTKELTYGVCYSYTILFIIIYIIGLMRRKKTA